MIKIISKLVLLLVIALNITIANAEQSQTIGDYTVHYIAVNSNFIPADIASQYDIVRGDRRAFLNISVLKNHPNGKTTPVTALVSGGKKNLFGQSKDIDFIKVTEGEAIYYLGQFTFSNREHAKFKIKVQPESLGPSYPIEWSTQLFNN